MGRREERRQAVRQRIVEAAVELHSTVGPARTTISAIAERAGVQRLTVYRHFPDELSIFMACTGHGLATLPPPDQAAWRRRTDPVARLQEALTDLYAYYRRREPVLVNVQRDAPLMPVLQRVMAARYGEYFASARKTLSAGWGVRGRQRTLLVAALGHAIDFQTWRSLVRQHGLSDDQAVELMVCLVRCAAEGG